MCDHNDLVNYNFISLIYTLLLILIRLIYRIYSQCHQVHIKISPVYMCYAEITLEHLHEVQFQLSTCKQGYRHYPRAMIL